MRNMFFFWFFLLLCCSSKKAIFTPTENELYLRAERAFKEKKYTRAIKILEEFQVRFSRSSILPDALILLGQAYLMNKEYVLAENKFKQIAERYPDSRFAEKASYFLAKTYLLRSPRPELDQEYTHKAIEFAEEFLSSYPGSILADSAKRIIELAREKLAYKLYLSAQLYYKLSDYDATMVYINEFLKYYKDTSIAPYVVLLSAKIHKARKELELARAQLQMIIDEYPNETKVKKEAQKEMRKLK